jgi:small-conductance mechanosensitive channel
LKPGDLIFCDDISGRVEKIGPKSVLIKDHRDERHVMSNFELKQLGYKTFGDEPLIKMTWVKEVDTTFNAEEFNQFIVEQLENHILIPKFDYPETSFSEKPGKKMIHFHLWTYSEFYWIIQHEFFEHIETNLKRSEKEPKSFYLNKSNG